MPELAFIIPEDPAPRWANAEGTAIECRVIFPDISPDPMPYTAAQSDPGWTHSEKIFGIFAHNDLGIPVAGYVPPPEPVPASISDRQFAHELRKRGVISQAEAVAFVARGEFPAALSGMIAALPDQTARDDAEILLAGATIFERSHPLTAAFAAGLGMNSAQTDDFFRDAAKR